MINSCSNISEALSLSYGFFRTRRSIKSLANSEISYGNWNLSFSTCIINYLHLWLFLSFSFGLHSEMGLSQLIARTLRLLYTKDRRFMSITYATKFRVGHNQESHNKFFLDSWSLLTNRSHRSLKIPLLMIFLQKTWRYSQA